MAQEANLIDRSVVQARASGFWAAFLLNGLLLVWALLHEELVGFVGLTLPSRLEVVLGLPWLLNGFVVFGSLIVNPQFTLGFMFALAISATAGILYVPSCLITGLALSAAADAAESSDILSLGFKGSNEIGDLFGLGFFIFFNAIYAIVWMDADIQRSRRTMKRAI